MKFRHRLAVNTLALAAALAAALPAQSQGRPDLVAASLNLPGVRYVPDEVLVQFRPGAAALARQGALGSVGASVKQAVLLADQRRDGKGDLQLLRLPMGMDMGAALQQLQADGSVEFAEPNWIYTHDAKFNDTYYVSGQLWGMYGDASPKKTNIYGSQAGEAWDKGQLCSKEVYVGVIDEGAMFSHEDLAKNFWTNPFDPVNGKDDDGNGKIDDVHGWDFFNKDSTTFDGAEDDHGTHVSGTIGGVGGNKKGVAGVCQKVTLISAKFLGPAGGSTADAIKSIDYITDLKTRHGLNIVATNNSWGGGGYSQALKDAIKRSGDADILFVAAAGNEGSNSDTTPHYPAAYNNENLISVASITSVGGLSSFSNYGLTTVDLGAPGSGVWSTVPRSDGSSGYASYSGTSMATPHVTGAVALYASLHPGASAAEIKAAILAATVPTPSLAGKTVTGGRLDVSGF